MTIPQVPMWRLTDRLRRAREHAGLEQAELAEIIGLSRNSVGNYERGLRHAPRYVITAWGAATGVSPEWIETGSTSRTAADDALDEVDRVVAGLSEYLRARRDSNPQPSDWESSTCIVCGHSAASHRAGGRCAYYGCPCAQTVFTGRRADLAVAA